MEEIEDSNTLRTETDSDEISGSYDSISNSSIKEDN